MAWRYCQDMKTVTFQSKVDTWIAAALVLAAASTLWGAVQSGQWLPLAIVVGIIAAAVFPLRYELHDDALVVRSGLIRYRRPYVDIVAATPNRSPFSAPALSLDRLLIRSRSSLGVNISPADRERFLDALVQRAPHLTRTDDGLVCVGEPRSGLAV
mgnify:CR=1 FL=1